MSSTRKTFAGVEFEVWETSFIPVATGGPPLATKNHSMDQMMEVIAEWINEAQDRQRTADIEMAREFNRQLVKTMTETELVD